MSLPTEGNVWAQTRGGCRTPQVSAVPRGTHGTGTTRPSPASQLPAPEHLLSILMTDRERRQESRLHVPPETSWGQRTGNHLMLPLHSIDKETEVLSGRTGCLPRVTRHTGSKPGQAPRPRQHHGRPGRATGLGFRMSHTFSFILHPPNKCFSICMEHAHSKAPRGGGKSSGWGQAPLRWRPAGIGLDVLIP